MPDIFLDSGREVLPNFRLSSKDLNPGRGKESLVSVLSSPLSDLNSRKGQQPREKEPQTVNLFRSTTPIVTVPKNRSPIRRAISNGYGFVGGREVVDCP